MSNSEAEPANHNQDQPAPVQQQPEPNEQQPLLQSDHRPDHESLDPLNESYVWLYRLFLLLLSAVSVGWIIVLVVDTFVSLGLKNTAGSGFEVLAASLVALFSLVISIVFYRVPSPIDRALSKIAASILGADMLVILTVRQLRHRLGLVCVLIGFGGCLLTFLLAAFSDTLVFWGKQAQQEQARQGATRPRARRPSVTWGQSFAGFLDSTARFLLLVLVSLITINLVIDAFDAETEPLGQLVSVGGSLDGANSGEGTEIHVACTPAGMHGPIVIVEAGETSAEEFVRWVLHAEKIRMVCYWDRPGLGFSDNAPSPIAMGYVESYLSAALERVVPDFNNQSLVLVSHGVGSLYSRVFAAKRMQQVQGMMMIDGLHEQLFYEQERWYRGLWHFTRGLVDSFAVTKLTGIFTGHDADARIYGLAEPEQPRYHKALLQQQVSAGRRSRVDIELATAALPGDLPIMVVSSASRIKDRTWAKYQRKLLQLTDNALAWKILEGPHELWRNRRSGKELAQLLTGFVQYI